jgi:hypothetical protein
MTNQKKISDWVIYITRTNQNGYDRRIGTNISCFWWMKTGQIIKTVAQIGKLAKQAGSLILKAFRV